MSKKIYIAVNAAVIAVAAILFYYFYSDPRFLFKDCDTNSIILITAVAATVHLLKAFRLYFALLGSGLGILKHLKQYCKAAIIRVILPFKTGEFFQMYCYGYNIKNFMRGAVIVLTDRFADTLALVTLLLFMPAFGERKLTGVYIIFAAFIMLIIFLYAAFPSIYKYWKNYLIKTRADAGTLAALKTLDYLNKLYKEMSDIITGKGIILYILSLCAWAVEIGCMFLIYKAENSNGAIGFVSTYLEAAMHGTGSVLLLRFIFISVVLMAVFYLILQLLTLKPGRKG